MTARELDAASLLQRVARQVPPALRANVVVIGSIATAWAFRDVSGTHTVATKDIDLLLRPAVDAVAAAETLGRDLLADGWTPYFTHGRTAGTADTRDDELPVLRLSPPEDSDGWFVELLAESPQQQHTRRQWQRVHTALGDFGLPSFRYMAVAVHGADATGFGLRVARPARMALAHLLEHAEPDRTPISNLPGTPPRFTKDLGRAIALWWLAREQSPLADGQWLAEWRVTLADIYPDGLDEIKAAARRGLESATPYLRDAHGIARNGVLAAHGTTLQAFVRAHGSLGTLIDQL